MQAITKYRSLFTGKQIDEILQSVRDKIDKSAITDDYQAGGEDKLVSAEGIKALSQAFDNTFTPEGVRDLLETADDSNIFTDADKRKVNGINVQFKGTVVDVPSRDAIDTSQFAGGEVILLLRNIADITEFQYWDNVNHLWEPVASGSGERDRVTLPAGTTIIADYDMNELSAAKYLVHGRSAAGDSHVAEVLITSKLTNINWTMYGEVTSGADVFTLAVDYSGTTVSLSATTTQASSVLTIVKVADF